MSTSARQYREDLDATTCATPGCQRDHTVLYLVPSCHHVEDVLVRYEKATGELILACSKCLRTVTRIAVAAKGATVQ